MFVQKKYQAAVIMLLGTFFSCYSTFKSPLKAAGNAKVEFYNISNSSDPAMEVYVTYNTNKTVKIMLDQVATADGWVDLGVYNFDAKEGEGVTVVRGRGNTRVNSVRFTETKDEPLRTLALPLT